MSNTATITFNLEDRQQLKAFSLALEMMKSPPPNAASLAAVIESWEPVREAPETGGTL